MTNTKPFTRHLKTNEQSYNAVRFELSKNNENGQKRYLKETKPRQAARGKLKPMQIMSEYRNHLCELHTDENGVRRCLTGKCPLSFSTCYNNASFADYWNSSPGPTKRKTKKVIKEQMKLENWPDLDKL